MTKSQVTRRKITRPAVTRDAVKAEEFREATFIGARANVDETALGVTAMHAEVGVGRVGASWAKKRVCVPRLAVMPSGLKLTLTLAIALCVEKEKNHTVCSG